MAMVEEDEEKKVSTMVENERVEREVGIKLIFLNKIFGTN